MTGFLFKELSEKEKDEIKKEAKGIMDNFGKELEKVKGLPEEAGIERGSGYREEGECIKSATSPTAAPKCPSDAESGEDLKKRILDNAPQKNKDFIIAEKKKW